MFQVEMHKLLSIVRLGLDDVEILFLEGSLCEPFITRGLQKVVELWYYLLFIFAMVKWQTKNTTIRSFGEEFFTY